MRIFVPFIFLFATLSTFAKNTERPLYLTDPVTGETQLLLGSHRPIKWINGGRCSRRPGCYLHQINYSKYTIAWRCETKDEQPCPWMY